MQSTKSPSNEEKATKTKADLYRLMSSKRQELSCLKNKLILQTRKKKFNGPVKLKSTLTKRKQSTKLQQLRPPKAPPPQPAQAPPPKPSQAPPPQPAQVPTPPQAPSQSSPPQAPPPHSQQAPSPLQAPPTLASLPTSSLSPEDKMKSLFDTFDLNKDLLHHLKVYMYIPIINFIFILLISRI